MRLIRPIVGLLAAAALPFLSGCIGLGVGFLGNVEDTLSCPHISAEKGVVVASKTAKPWLAAEDLERYWGKPDSIDRRAGGAELWRYDFGLRWNGIGVLVAFLPIPVMLPIGHEYIEFTIEGGSVMSARTLEFTWIGMAGCLASGVPHAGGAGCFREGRPERGSSFSAGYPGAPNIASKVRVINGTIGPVSVVHRGGYSKIKETRFVLDPGKSRTVLTESFGTIAASDGAGRPVLPKGERFTHKIQTDSTMVFLITDGHIVPVPPRYWDDWEAHLRDIADVKFEGAPNWAGDPEKSF